MTISRSALRMLCAMALSMSAAVASGQQALLTARHIPAAVTSGKAQPLGKVEGSRILHVSIALPLRNQQKMHALLRDLYDRNSPQWHKFLKRGEFAERFGPTQADYDKLTNFANANGLRIVSTFPQRTLLTVEAPAATVERVFHVSLLKYKHPTEDRDFFAPDREPTLDLGIPVLDVRGLDSYYRNRPHSKRGTAARNNPQGMGTGPSGAYLPQDMRAAYYGLGSLTGGGQSMDIVSFDGYNTSDLTLMYSTANITATVPVTNILVDSYNGACSYDGAGDGSCDDAEQTLDIVNASAMAPGMTGIYFYEIENSNSDPSLPLYTQIAANDDANIISSSWSGDPNNTAEEDMLAQIAMQGQTLLNASGDSGAYDDNTWEGFPGGEPLVTEIGATTLATTSQNGSQFVTYGSEVGWSDSGGGIAPSDYNPQPIPAYQQIAGVITMANGGSTTYRNSPDLAAEGDFDNLAVSNGSVYYDYGGTSFAAPRWAGYMTLMNEQSIAEGYGPVGAVNTDLYDLGTNTNPRGGTINAGIYNDVTSGSNPAGDGGASYNAVAGYDLVTGWGSPNNGDIIDTLAPTITVSPATGTQATQFTITYNQPEATGTATSTSFSSLGFLNPGNCSLSSSGICSLTLPGSTFGPGSFAIGYSYQNDSETINSQSLGLGSILDNVSLAIATSRQIVGPSQSVTFTVTATDTSYSSQVVAGVVRFADNDVITLGTCTLSNGTCGLTVTGSQLQTGSNTITLDGSAINDSEYIVTSAGSADVRLTGANAAGIGVTVSPNPAVVGQTVMFQAAVTGSAGTATGTVNFYANNVLFDSVTLDGSGVASGSMSTAGYPAANYSVVAIYTGDSNYSVSISTAYSFVLNKYTPTVTVSSATNLVSSGQSVTLTANVTGGDGTATGQVTFSTGGIVLGAASLSSGTASITFSTAGSKPGSYKITASYAGSSDYKAATSAAYIGQITKAPTSTTLMAMPTTVTPPDSVTLTATVARTASGTSGTPGGTVTFLFGHNVLGTASVDGSGLATFTGPTTGIRAGTYSVTALYGGDGFDSASTSSGVDVTVQ
jgi:hypothetical protein